jgi:hypothetical protein
VSLGSRRPMNPMVHLDLRDLFFCKKYGHLMNWSTPVDLGHNLFDLGHNLLDLGYNVVDLGYDVLDKNKRVRERRSRKISRKIF